MDTHIIDADLGHAGVGLALPIGLPGEGSPSPDPFSARERLGTTSSPETAVPGEAGTSSPAVRIRRARRSALLAGVAAVVLIGLGGAGLYAFRKDIQSGNLTHRLAAMISGSANQPLPAPTEAGMTAHAVVGLAPATLVQPSGPAHVTAAKPVDSATTLAREFAALQSFGKPGDAAPVALDAGVKPAPPIPAAAPSAGSVKPAQAVVPPPSMSAGPQEAGVVLPAVPSEASKTMPAALSAAPAIPVATAAPVTTAPAAAAPVPVPVPAPREPATIAAELKAGPLTSAQQVEVVGLVKSLGAQLRDTRIEVTQLHQVVAQLAEKVETRTTDFENRLGLSEASAIVQSSARAGSGPLPSETPAPPPPPVSTSQPVRLASTRNTIPLPAAAAPLPERRTVKDYMVKGASPGLAVLAALNPMAGSGSVIEVGVGDPVPGLGRVKRVYQRGTTWIVETENGSIQQ